MAALTTQPLRAATKAVERRAASLSMPDVWEGMATSLTVPADLDVATCDEGQFRSWVLRPEAFIRSPRLAIALPGQRDYVWAVDIQRGQRLIIDVMSMASAPSREPRPTGVDSEIDAILRSIVVGHWG